MGVYRFELSGHTEIDIVAENLNEARKKADRDWHSIFTNGLFGDVKFIKEIVAHNLTEYGVEYKQKVIFNYHGLDTQLEKLSEECLELALAVKHKDRPVIGIGNLIEEMADVLNLIEQIINNSRDIKEGVHRFREYKVDRELSRIGKEI